MTVGQKWVAVVGLVLFVVAGLFPPWMPNERLPPGCRVSSFQFLMLGTAIGDRLDGARLAAELAIISAITGVSCLVVGPTRKSIDRKQFSGE